MEVLPLTAKPRVLPEDPFSTSESVDLFGSLAEFPLPNLLIDIVERELSGDLQVISGRAIRAVYFDRGFLVFAGSNLKKDRLGRRLLKVGRVTEQELERAGHLMKGKQRIGQAMVEAGLLSEDELGQEVARQARQIVLTLFSLREGLCSFDERECVIPMELRLGLSVYRLLLEGTRRMTSENLIMKGLGTLDRRVRPAEMTPFSLEESELWAIERRVLEAAQNGEKLGELLNRLDDGKVHVLRAAYGLLCAGILEPDDGAGRVFKVQEEFGTFLLSELDKKARSTEVEDVRQEVLLRFDSLEQTSPTELLDVEDSADEEAIDLAYEAREKEWEKKQILVDNEKSLYVKVEEIRRQLARARAQLLGERRGVDSGSFGDDVGVRAEGLPESTDQVVTEMVKAEDVPVDGDSGPLDLQESEGTSVSGIFRAGPPITEEHKKRLKQLFYEIKVRKAVGDREGAISLLYEVVKLEPRSAKFEALLAEALSSHRVLRQRAERHFRRALSLDPQNPDLRCAMGKYYLSFNLRSRALAEFKTALRIDPQHSGAKNAMAEFGKVHGEANPMEKVFRKLFGS